MRKQDIPSHWTLTTVGEAGEARLGKQRSPQWHTGPNMRPYLRVANVFEDRIDLTDVMSMHFEPGEVARYELAAEDILLNEGQSPELLGRPAMYRGELPGVCFTNSLIRFRAGSGVLPAWALLVFRHHMHSGRFRQESRVTTNIAHLALGRLKTVEFPVPPLVEQHALVAEFERRTTMVDAGISNLCSASRKVEALRRSVLGAALEGRLAGARTRLGVDNSAADELAAAGVPRTGIRSTGIREGWATCRVGDLAKVGSGATPSRRQPRYWEDGDIPWITSGQLTPPFVRGAREMITKAALAETPVKLWPAGTLLVAMYGEGRTRGLCSELAFDATTNQACAALVLPGPLAGLRPWIKLYFAASYERNRRLASGGVQPNLSLGTIQSLEVPIPPARDRAALLAEVDRRMSLIDTGYQTLRLSGSHAQQLRISLLARAVSGKLTRARSCVPMMNEESQ